MRHTHIVRAGALLLTAVTLAACGSTAPGTNSNSAPTPSPSATASPNAVIIQTGWGICCSLTGTGSSMDCSAPKTNCFDEVVVKGVASSPYRRFNESVDRGTTAAFFAGDEWKQIFPDLDKFPEQLGMLRNGMPLLRFESGTKGLVRYVATRQSREEILGQTRGKGPTTISGVEFALSVREEQ